MKEREKATGEMREVHSEGLHTSYLNIVTVKVKVQFTIEQATKVQRGSKGIALLFL